MTQIFHQRTAFGPQPDLEHEDLSELYHEQSKLHALPGQQIVAKDNYSLTEIEAMGRAYKQYRRARRVPLPTGLADSDRRFDDVVASRRSVRSFADRPLTLHRLSKVLHQTYGITKYVPGMVCRQPLRAAPSAGGLYPGEIYLAVRTVEGLEPALYHYNVREHALELLREGDPTEVVHQACCFQELARRAAVVVFIAAVFERTKRKYGLRGYRYAMLDIGHLAQNLYLACTSLNMAVVTTCAFFDDDANALLRIDGVDESVVYAGFIGEWDEVDESSEDAFRQAFMRAEYGPS